MYFRQADHGGQSAQVRFHDAKKYVMRTAPPLLNSVFVDPASKKQVAVYIMENRQRRVNGSRWIRWRGVIKPIEEGMINNRQARCVCDHELQARREGNGGGVQQPEIDGLRSSILKLRQATMTGGTLCRELDELYCALFPGMGKQEFEKIRSGVAQVETALRESPI